MSLSNTSLFQALPFMLLSMILVIPLSGCGGGGSSGGAVATAGSNLGGDSTFYVEDVLFGRPRFDPGGALIEIINPASLLEKDPITGLELEGYPQPLFPEEELDQFYSFNLGETTSSTYKVKIIPRNAAVILDFTLPVDRDSLNLDENLKLTEKSPISLVSDVGAAVEVEVYWGGDLGLGQDKVVINPVTGKQIGYPASPLFFDQEGNPKAPESGFLQLTVVSGGLGPYKVKSTDGKILSARQDLFASPLKPLGFNPGNAELDFIDYGEVSFNGFLPDLSAPRIIREVRAAGTITEIVNPNIFKDDSQTFVTAANGGIGEWGGALLVLRPGKKTEERLKVVENSENTITIDQGSGEAGFSIPPEVGDDYELKRAEFFEPIPGTDLATAVDPVTHPKDPDDPEDEMNSDLFRFAFLEQLVLDEVTGKPVIDPETGGYMWETAEVSPGVPYDPGSLGVEPINPGWRISFRFSEPMALEAFRPFETFFVVNAAVDIEDPGFEHMLPGRSVASDNNRVISFEPVVEDQFNEEIGLHHLGFGGKAKTLRLVIRVVPPYDNVNDFYKSLGPDPAKWPEEVVEDMDKEGVLGVFDLGGQALGLPAAFLDKGSPHSVINKDSPGRGAFVPAVDLKYEFNTLELPELEYPETGVMVHRFMGLPETGVEQFPEQITGIVFNDHPDLLYGPSIADTSVGLNGFLSGRSVEFIQHVFDDYNHPPPSSPTYPDPIFKMPFGTGTPINCSYGCRFMHVYRRGDASPDVDTFGGTILDLIKLSWAPIGGWVTNTLIEKMSIGISYSNIIPNTNQDAGIPDDKNSGLKSGFKGNIANNPIEGLPNQIMVVGTENDGIPYVVDWRDLFGPKNQGQGANYNDYLPWPLFETAFPYDSSKSLLIEYRMNPNVNAGVALSNGFAFHAGIISSMLPRFRIYTRGDNPANPNSVVGLVHAVTDPFNTKWTQAQGPLANPGKYGDNSRYLMVFDYVKRLSLVESPFLGADVDQDHDIWFLNPVIVPPVDDLPEGTNLDLQFRSTPNPDSTASYSPWSYPGGVEAFFNKAPFNNHNFMRFKAIFEANVEAGVVPSIDTIAIPYRIEKQ
jgi:hypothetical protein